MRKVPFLLALGSLLVVMTGCRSEQTTPTSNVPTLAVTPTLPPSPVSWPTTAPGQAVCRTVPPIGALVEGLPPVTAQDWSHGPADAPVTLIEYADFQ